MFSWGAEGLTVLVASTWVNVANFVVFDIFLVSLLYFVTTDVAGRFNHRDIRSGDSCQLFLVSPPLIGGGLGSTSSLRTALLLFVRLFGLGLIFVSNLTINGKSVVAITDKNVTLVAPGSVANFSEQELEESRLLRQDCWVTIQNKSNEVGILAYGEIRDGKCELEQPGVVENAVQISMGVTLRNVTTGKCRRYEERVRRFDDGIDMRKAVFWCENGNLVCGFDQEIPEKVDLENCLAWIEYKNITYIAEGFLSFDNAVWPEMPEEAIGAIAAKNLDVFNEEWLSENLFGPGISVIDTVHTVYGAGRETRTVKVNNTRLVTTVSPFWFVALGLKVILTLLLTFASISLWALGYRPMANDEKNLAKMLQNLIDENHIHHGSSTQNDTSSIYLVAQLSDFNNRVNVYAIGGDIESSIITGVDDSDPNFEAHAEEALFY